MSISLYVGAKVRIRARAGVEPSLRGRLGVVESIDHDEDFVIVGFSDNDPDGPDSYSFRPWDLVPAYEPWKIRDLQNAAHALACHKGWWEKPRELPELLALIHSEISEALQAYRDGMPVGNRWETRPDGKPEGVAVELADAVIRIFDLCEYFGIDLEEVLWAKMDYNRTRPKRHGGKRV